MDQSALVDISKHLSDEFLQIERGYLFELYTPKLMGDIERKLNDLILQADVYNEALQITTRFRIVTNTSFNLANNSLAIGCWFAFEDKRDAMRFKLMWG